MFITFFITDDHALFAQSIGHLLEQKTQCRIRLLGYATTEEETMVQLYKLKPDVLLLDINMPQNDGMVLLLKTKQLFSHMKIIMLTAHNDANYLRYCMQHGANGYVLKTSAIEVLVDSIQKVYQGETYIDETMSNTTAASQVQLDSLRLRHKLTVREAEVLLLVANGYTNKQIGEQFFISETTVQTHRRNLKSKLKIRNTADLVRLVFVS